MESTVMISSLLCNILIAELALGYGGSVGA